MIIINPTLYIDKDNIIKVVTVEMPEHQEFGCNGKLTCCHDEKALQQVKDSAILVENQYYIKQLICEPCNGWGGPDVDFNNIIDPDTFYILTGKYELEVNEMPMCTAPNFGASLNCRCNCIGEVATLTEIIQENEKSLNVESYKSTLKAEIENSDMFSTRIKTQILELINKIK